MKTLAEQLIAFQSTDETSAFCGSFDGNLGYFSKYCPVSLTIRDDTLRITGEEEQVHICAAAAESILALIRAGKTPDEVAIRYAIDAAGGGEEQEVQQLAKGCICITQKGKPISPKTVGQKRYIQSIEQNTITFGVGPAGTGKTYLAVAMAVKAFKAGMVSRIVLTRPAVEAGEKLGFLPGDLQNKVDPYLRPLYDALFDFLGAENFQRLQERGSIEVAPLAYMRGRTLDESFIILDEAQNTTREQMKMFLTRMGFGSKIVVTGDITQIDLPVGKVSGLVEATRVLKNVDDIAINRFTEKDVVRHKLVQDIIRAYDRYYEEGKNKYHE
jgi:phosphate starvation-inducible PhoH-like protein